MPKRTRSTPGKHQETEGNVAAPSPSVMGDRHWFTCLSRTDQEPASHRVKFTSHCTQSLSGKSVVGPFSGRTDRVDTAHLDRQLVEQNYPTCILAGFQILQGLVHLIQPIGLCN